MPKDHSQSEVRVSRGSSPVRMSVADAATRIGVCEQTVRNMANAGQLAWFWGSGTIRPSGVIAQSVEDFIARRSTAGTSGNASH